MSTVIYINYDKIQVVGQSGEQYQKQTLLLKEGTVLNGVIVDSEEIIEQLKSIKPTITKASIVIDSSNVLLKRLSLPKIPKSKLLEVIQREFDMGEATEYYYDRNFIKSSKEEDIILSCAIPKELLNRYIEIFDKANIKIDCIDVAINGIVKYVNASDTLKDQTFLLNIVSQDAMISVLFENGIYQLSNRSRIHNDVDTKEYISELYAKLSTMIQFSKSKKTEYELQKSYYVGLSDESMNQLEQHIHDYGLSIDIKKKKTKDMEYFYPNLGLLTNKDDINLAVIKKEKISKKTINKTLLVAFPFCVIALIMVAFASLMMKEASLDKQIVSLEQEITSYESSQVIQSLEQIKTNNDDVLLQVNEYTTISDLVNAFQVVNPDFLRLIISDLEIESIAYSSSTTTLTVKGYSSNQDDIAAYSQMLRESSYGDGLYYNGYSIDSRNGGQYAFSIQAFFDVSESEDSE